MNVTHGRLPTEAAASLVLLTLVALISACSAGPISGSPFRSSIMPTSAATGPFVSIPATATVVKPSPTLIGYFTSTLTSPKGSVHLPLECWHLDTDNAHCSALFPNGKRIAYVDRVWWSPDEHYAVICVQQTRDSQGCLQGFEVWDMIVGEGPLLRLPDMGSTWMQWAPTGDLLAYYDPQSAGHGGGSVTIYDFDSGQQSTPAICPDWLFAMTSGAWRRVCPQPLATPPSGGYSFGPATVVLTSTGNVDIAAWLPDSKRLLITRSDTEHPGDEYIETFDVNTRQLQCYGRRHNGLTPPVWVAAGNRVAYTGMMNQQTDLWIAGIDGIGAESPAMENVWASIATFNDHPNTVVVVDGHPLLVDGSRRAIGAVAMNLEPWGFSARESWAGMAAAPVPRLLAIYDNQRLLIVDLSVGSAHPIDLGSEASEAKGYGPRWVLGARWSPDARYLAMETSVGQPVLHFSDLRLLDYQSGEVRLLELPTRYVTDIAWAPDSKYMLVLGRGLLPDTVSWQALYLVNVESREVRPVLPGTTPDGSARFASLAWSPDGSTVAFRCPSETEGRLCTIPVTRN